ncbi:SidA/IucD/PvdA family monooxygenase [Kineosporia rhizophila]|uniref:lysine N(6)-hydroxylase/L-ornithine N(5)-oxygenase family protein n=1 Tax=Kineosporia TaxID=49184 RepID=UPI000AFDC079|nr:MULTISPECIES: lysine N(6)-hydroxylase/L-ornithine N(5)-oxygenase family protein [Kineosporia]MCE0535665.1 SidA/IucD/PvdA family monooxygenase [Kineosporia rhizophila]GLY17690.1 lysine/ornithine N-monooxygenase [Kineosporia sp. NBRC 101677]
MTSLSADGSATGTVDDPDRPIYDLIGIGFGPSNLALAIAAVEHNDGAGDAERVAVRFFERQPTFGWHRGMLLDDATMQVSFLKDLVTLRNPASQFSFLAYLHECGRLVDFINHKTLFPLRVEFHAYLEWAAARVADLVDWGHEVVALEPVLSHGEVVAVDVTARELTPDGDGREVTYRARNVVIGTGLRPRFPEGISGSEHVWHNHQLLHRVEEIDAASAKRFVVVGAGQSAAEVTAFLHERFADAEIVSVFSRYGYSPADDSPFANRIFDPAAVDDFFDASPEVRQMLLNYHANTNYSVVDGELIEELYRRSYQEKVNGRERLTMLNVSRVEQVREQAGQVAVTVRSLTSDRRVEIEADLAVFATGYDPVDPRPLLGDLAGLCPTDENGRLRIRRDYRVETAPGIRAGIYLQGGTEHTHGLSSSLLSTIAVRAGEILSSVVGNVSAEVDEPSAGGAKAPVAALRQFLR